MLHEDLLKAMYLISLLDYLSLKNQVPLCRVQPMMKLRINPILCRYSDDILTWFEKNIKKVVLGFVPMNSAGYKVEELKKDNTTMFIKGDTLNIIERENLRISSLSHA